MAAGALREEYRPESDYHGHPNYSRVYVSLLVLLVVGLVVGALLGNTLLAILVVFGTAFIKATLVVANFMHMRYEPWLIYVLMGAFGLVVLALFWFVFPDIVI